MSKMNRAFRFFISFVLVVSTVISGIIPSSAAESGFKDVQDPNAYYFEPVYWAVEKGITKGTSATEFSPQLGCSRADCVTFLYRYAREPKVDVSAVKKFKDVKGTEYYGPAVAWAVENNITSGTSSDEFSPKAECTRAQIVTFLWRYNSEPSVDYGGTFTDVNEKDYYSRAVAWAVEQGITKGTSETEFSPQGICNRAQIVSFLYRMDQAAKNTEPLPTIEYTEEIEKMIESNGGELPEIYLEPEGNVPEGIIGTFSDKKVIDADSAIESLKDITGLMQIDNADKEFVEADSSQSDNINYFRLQQMYNGYKVFGKQLIISSDENGTIYSLTGDYDPLKGKVNETEKISKEQAYQKAKEVCHDIDESAEKILYSQAEESYEYAWLFSGSMTVIVSAKDGAVLNSWNNFEASYTPKTGKGRKSNSQEEIEIRTVLDDKDTETASDDEYLFYDSKRNIAYYDSKRDDYSLSHFLLPYETETNSVINKTKDVRILRSIDNNWSGEAAEKAITLYDNLNKTFDYYKHILNINSYDNRGSLIIAGINHGRDSGNNAYNYGPEKALSDKRTVIRLLFGYNSNLQNDLAVVGHEFTHAVQKSLIPDLEYQNETGALMEAYSDLAGQLVSLYAFKETDWKMGNERNLVSPADTGNPSTYKGKNWDYDLKFKDYGGVHNNSTVISHAVYQMYNNGINDVSRLSKLLYNTWKKLSGTGEFSDYAVSMMAAANEMDMTQQELKIIRLAFEDAGISCISIREYPMQLLKNFLVINEDGDVIPNAVIELNDQLTKITDDNGIVSIGLNEMPLSNWMIVHVKVKASGYEVFQKNYLVPLCFTGDIKILLNRESGAVSPGIISDSWDQIIASVNDGTYKSKYNIGDTKALDLGSEGIIEMQIAAFDADEMADGRGKAAITWISKDLLKSEHRMNPNLVQNDSSTNSYVIGTGTIGGWANSEMREWLKSEIMPLIPETVRNAIKPVVKYSASYDAFRYWIENQKTTDDVWIPSYREVAGKGSGYYETEGPYYSSLFGSSTDRVKLKSCASDASWWWLRSASNMHVDSFCDVNSTGGFTLNINNVTDEYGIALGFCM